MPPRSFWRVPESRPCRPGIRAVQEYGHPQVQPAEWGHQEPGCKTTECGQHPGSGAYKLTSVATHSMDNRPSDPCAECGRDTDACDPEITLWMVSTERGQRRFVCPECTRHHLRAMEAKLDREFW